MEVQGVDEDPGVGSSDTGDDIGRRVEVADLHPRRELEVDGQSEVACKVAEASEVVDRPAPIRIGKLADDVPGADRCRRLEETLQLVWLVLRSETGELDVEDLDVAVGEPRLYSLDHRRIPHQRGDLLAGRHRGRAQPDEVVPGLGGDVDLIEGRDTEHRQMREGELRRRHGTGLP